MPNLVISRSPESKAGELEQRKADTIKEVNAKIGAVREEYITPIPGQEMIYSAKEEEAKAFNAIIPRPNDLSELPFLDAEIGITAPSAQELADLWIQMADEWRTIGPLLEQLRLGTIKAIKEATATTEVDTAMSDLINSLEGL
jgi:hypothetical protein